MRHTNAMFFALLLVSLACTAHSSAPNPLVLEADVVVVGAGYAGLTSARHLTAKGMKVVVLEASNTSGGRTKNWDLAPGISAPDRVSPHVVELGGQWIGNKTVQKDAWELIVEELGFEVVCRLEQCHVQSGLYESLRCSTRDSSATSTLAATLR